MNMYLHEAYMAVLANKIPDHTVTRFVRQHSKDMQKTYLFVGYSDDNQHLHSFIRIILDNRPILYPYFTEALKLARQLPQQLKHKVVDTRPFRFALPGNKEACSPYYVNMSPLGVLFFLFAWIKHFHPKITAQYISHHEFMCIKSKVDACRYSPSVLVLATAKLHDNPHADVCKAIEEATQQESQGQILYDADLIQKVSLNSKRLLHH
jgi:hypothetical protein